MTPSSETPSGNDAAAPLAPAAPAAETASPLAAAGTPASTGLKLRDVLLGAALLMSVLSLAWLYSAQQRWDKYNEELVRRQQEALQQAVESRTLARQAEAVSRDMSAKMALLEARVSESAMQRSQLEELMQSLSRSRDENVLADIEAALRVAQQQAALTGSVEPLATVLRQTDERLARVQQPRLERVRRAAIQDLEKVRGAGFVDITSLTIRLDEVTRQVSDLPLLAGHSPVAQRSAAGRAAPAAPMSASASSAAPAPVPAPVPAPSSGRPVGAAGAQESDGQAWTQGAMALARHVWAEVRGLIRVTRVDEPEAALLAPENAFFLRENLRLRLLNARLSLLSRQFDAAQDDLRQSQALLERYFDKSSRRVAAAIDLLKQVAAQSRAVAVPRPEATLSAIAAAAPGR